MLKLTLVFLGIIVVLYLLIGFGVYGFAVGEQKHIDNERKKYLGLSIEGMKFKAATDNSKIKLIGLITCLILIPVLMILEYKKNKTADFPSLDHFSIW